jgi:selenide,water dikinase
LAEALKGLPQSAHADLLVGFNKADDAGVYRINDSLALVQTVDFFPPIVDDAFYFGQIAAANALSDVFAMGGRPLTALNIIGFPAGKLPDKIFTEILRGGSEKIEEAGAVVVGGHSIKDNEIKYGVAVTGVVAPDKIVTNAGARAGDVLFLTKSLGTGIITTGIKRGAVDATLTALVIEQMAALNQKASELMVRYDAHAATDVTGYGLLGHAFEMAEASRVGFELFADRLPVIPEAVTLAGHGMNPGGANDNRAYLEQHVEIDSSIDKNLVQVLYDPQTSGGLLIAVAVEKADEFSAALQRQGLHWKAIGRARPADRVALTVRTN